MRVVFMGTPDFALCALKALCESRHEVVAVVTQPDRLGNRGELTAPPVKKYALSVGLPVYQYEKVSKQGVSDLKSLSADIFVTVAYGQLLSKEVIDLPPFGIINAHASLLPKYRGSCPVQCAIINGEEQTGVTIMQTDVGLDTGDILYVKKCDILPEDNAETLFDKLAELGANALIEYLDLLESGNAPVPVKQDEAQASYFPMLKKTDGKIDWCDHAKNVLNRIRGLTPWPGAYTSFGGKILKVHLAKACDGIGKCGEIIKADKNGLAVACGEGAIELVEVQLEGKKRTSGADFVNGARIKIGDNLG